MKRIVLLVLPMLVGFVFFNFKNKSDNDSTKQTPQYSTASANVLTEMEKKNGWKLLFDGKTLTGWRSFKKQTAGKDWIVDETEKAMLLNATQNPDGGWQAKDGGDLITVDEFENYELRLDWKIAPCGNSGIIFNVLERDSLTYVWQSGPEMQVLDNTCHPDAKIPKHRAGDLYDLIACSRETVKPVGEWNSIRLIIKNGHLEQWLNDVKSVETEMWTPEWNAMVAKSKFAKMPLFGTARRGHIALQDHGNKVWFRNVKLRKL